MLLPPTPFVERIRCRPEAPPSKLWKFCNFLTLWAPGKPRLTLFQHPGFLYVRRNPLRLRDSFRRQVVVREHQCHHTGFRVAIDLVDLHRAKTAGLHSSAVLLERDQVARARAEVGVSSVLVTLDERRPACVRAFL